MSKLIVNSIFRALFNDCNNDNGNNKKIMQIKTLMI